MCNITYTSLNFDENARTITLDGTAEDCRAVSAALISPQFTTRVTAPVQADGTWTAVFTENEFLAPDQEIKDRCGMGVKIDAQCVSDPDCRGPRQFVLSCEGGVACPSVSVEMTGASPCDADGRQTVTFEIHVTNATVPTVLRIDYGDGTEDTILNSEIAGGGAITRQHTYGAGSYAVVVEMLFPEGCPAPEPVSVEVSCEVNCPGDFGFEILDAQGNRYRVLDNISGVYQRADAGPGAPQLDCLPGEDFTVRLVGLNAQPDGITWREDEDPPVTTDLTEQGVHVEGGGRKSINATVTKSGCPPLSETVVVKTCGCKETDWSEWSECVDCVKTRTRTLRDCSKETETRPCTMPPTEWSPWSSTGFCSRTRSRRGENCQVEVQTSVDLCCIWMWITLFLIALTGVFILVAFCMLPATFWAAVAALGSGGSLSAVWAALTGANVVLLVIAAILLVVSLIVLILWLIFCIFRDASAAACSLLATFIAVMAWLTAVSGLIAIVLSIIAALCAANVVCLFAAFGCAVGAWIDVAWFGIILAVATIIYSFLCGDGD